MVISRFSVVGVAATLCHMLIVWTLITMGISTLLANVLAFLSAFAVSFGGHYWWTFRVPGNPKRAATRFLIISSAAFAANNMLLVILLRVSWFSPVVSAVIAAMVIPVLTFMLSRLWAFQPGTRAPSLLD